MNRAQKRALAKVQIANAKQLTHQRQQIVKEEKEQFLKQPIWKRVKTFYDCIPSKKGRRVFWLWALPILLVFVPIQAILDLTKLNIAWKWSSQLYYSFVNGK